MKKLLAVILCFLIGMNTVLAEEVSRLYLIRDAENKSLKTSVNPVFNVPGYHLINDDDYMIYESPVKNLFNIIIFKMSGEDCYYYYLSNDGLELNKRLLAQFDSYQYDYKRIKNAAFLDLFYNDASEYLAKSRSSIKTVSDSAERAPLPQEDEYDFSDEAQERFDRQGTISQGSSSKPLSPSEVLTGSLIYIKEGTQFNAVLSSGISSESISNNDRISAQLMEDWMFDGVVVAPAGSLVNGNVVDSRPATFAMGNGRIGINFNEIITPEGKVIPLSTNKVYIVGDSSRPLKIAGKVAGGVLGGLAVAAISMLFGCDPETLIGGAAIGGALGTLAAVSTKGEDVDVPEGTSLQIMLAEPMTVQPYTSL